MSGERKPASDRSPWAYAVLGALGLVGLWALDTFTVQGFLVAVWPWADTSGLLWAWGTRLAWWVIFWQVGIAVEMRAVWREARLEVASRRQLWLAAHISLVHRLLRRTRFHWAAVPNALAQRQRRTAVDTVSSAPATVSSPVQDRPVSEPKAA